MHPAPRLEGDHCVLRDGRPGDVDELLAMFAAPEVRRWWHEESAEEIASRFERGDGTGWVIEAGGRTVGWVQAFDQDDPDYRHATIDIATAPEVHGTGIPLDALRAVRSWLVAQHGHHRLTIDPALDNARAAAAYRKLGFRDVGVMRRYERSPEGEWRDGLLMEWVAGVDPIG
jgi:aminoglycoside 6'-N-acetyltransferase